MKKLVLLVILATFILSPFLFAQNIGGYKESSYYYFSFPIEKIYVHRLGFMVLYRRNSTRLGRTFVPHEWFESVNGKGEMIYLGTGKEWPSLVVYYNEGEFSHVRLRVRRNRLHETWGVVPLNVNVDEYFQDIEEVKLQF